MPAHLLELLRGYLAHYGYGAVAAALLLENAGVPVPGETVLLLASFLAYSEHHLRLPIIVLVGICAATLGDNLGFLIGRHGGRPLLEKYRRFFRIRPATLERGERLFEAYGGATVFGARFIAGMRIIAGPLAGVLRMEWRRFVWFNFLGASLWVAVISGAGFFFGAHWDELVMIVRSANIALLIVAVAGVLALWWWKWRKNDSDEG